MLSFLNEHPGILFVAAAWLPLAAFVLILLASALWCLFRPYRDEENAGAKLYQLFGGDVPGRGPAYIALAAILASFLLSSVGAGLFFYEQHKYLTREAELDAEFPMDATDHGAAPAAPGNKADANAQNAKAAVVFTESHDTWRYHLRHDWSGRCDWVTFHPADNGADGRATAPPRTTSLEIGYAIDSLSALLFVMVTLVSLLIYLYSIGYLSAELSSHVEDHDVIENGEHLHRRGRFGRFFLFLSLFSFAMLNLVLANNFLQVFLFWELVGLCSYYLIGFYYERHSASRAAFKAFLVNRIGDIGFLVCLMILWTAVGTFHFEDVSRQLRCPTRDALGNLTERGEQMVRAEPVGEGTVRVTEKAQGSELVLFPINPTHDLTNPNAFLPAQSGDLVEPHAHPGQTEYGSMSYALLVVAGFGLFMGCVGKSAQFPLHVWLADAMEGPTPVSALIHAATMVAAGVYLVGRAYPLFTPEVLIGIAYIGCITLFIGASIAIVKTDIKKVLAYSTVSQLGFMMLALGVGGWTAGLLHLLTHAFFKALLFLAAGSLIYGCHHEQNLLRMGGLFRKMPVTAVTMLCGVLAIVGFPLFSGWYSKDAVLGAARGFVVTHPEHALLFWLPLATVALTGFYMFRLWFLAFVGAPRSTRVYENASESPWTMTVPLGVLAVLAIGVGWGWPIWDSEASFLGTLVGLARPGSVAADFSRELARAADSQTMVGVLTLFLSGLGVLFAALIYYVHAFDPAQTEAQFPVIAALLKQRYYLDFLYQVVFVKPTLALSRLLQICDVRILDGFLHTLAKAAVRLSRFDAWFDRRLVDGLIDGLGVWVYKGGSSLRGVQTGSLRSYILFLLVAAAGLFIFFSYFVNTPPAG